MLPDLTAMSFGHVDHGIGSIFAVDPSHEYLRTPVCKARDALSPAHRFKKTHRSLDRHREWFPEMTYGISLPLLQAPPPRGGEAPSQRELMAMGVMGFDLKNSGRVNLMNQIGSFLLIPHGGWSYGQSRLFQNGDVRLRWLLRRLVRAQKARLISDNLVQARRYVDVNPILTLAIAARENDESIAASGYRAIDTYDEGGLDFLWKERKELGLPPSLTRLWKPGIAKPNPETGNWVHPAAIPAKDQVIAYAATINAHFQFHFKHHLEREAGVEAPSILARASRITRMLWMAFSFQATGGEVFNPLKSLSIQATQHFGCRTALGYIAAVATNQGACLNLDALMSDPELNRSEWVRIAKCRVAETLFLERLLRTARELLPQA
jgi:hypothetical protein